MKKIFILILATLIFFNIAHAQNINECKTDIYFGNGVWNDSDDAKNGKEFLNLLVDLKIIDGDPKLQAKYGEVKLQYNWGQGTMLDVLETYYQLKAAGQVNNYQFFALMEILTGGNSVLAIGAVATQSLMEPFTKGWEQGNVDEMWTKYYNESFKLSHKVLLVSHSQGGLFANRIYGQVASSGYEDYFSNLQVASPASEVKAQKNDYVTLSTDLDSFDPVVNFIPGSMSPNASGDSGHAFVSAYLSQVNPLTKIITNMKQLLSSLDSESSQWETKEEFNKGTITHNITAKHRFDTSIESIQNVYPFEQSKKLYYINKGTITGHVKASCGGTEISPSWTGQKENEFYLINNSQEEKIIGCIPVEPILSGVSEADKETDIIITIDNYLADSTYTISITGGTTIRSGNTITWTLPSVTSDTNHTLSVSAIDSGCKNANKVATHDVNVIDNDTVYLSVSPTTTLHEGDVVTITIDNYNPNRRYFAIYMGHGLWGDTSDGTYTIIMPTIWGTGCKIKSVDFYVSYDTPNKVFTVQTISYKSKVEPTSNLGLYISSNKIRLRFPGIPDAYFYFSTGSIDWWGSGATSVISYEFPTFSTWTELRDNINSVANYHLNLGGNPTRMSADSIGDILDEDRINLLKDELSSRCLYLPK